MARDKHNLGEDIMKAKLSYLQFAAFFRTKPINFDNYAQNLGNIFFDDPSKILQAHQPVNVCPDDYTIIDVTDTNGYRIGISKARTDILYSAVDVYIDSGNYVEAVDTFIKKIKVFCGNEINEYNLCSRIGLISEFTINSAHPNEEIREHFCKKDFYQDISEINISFNRRETYLDTAINKLITIYSQNPSDEIQKDIQLKQDINTRGYVRALNPKFISSFLDKFSHDLSGSHVEDLINGK